MPGAALLWAASIATRMVEVKNLREKNIFVMYEGLD
jgi:hypothetical protein